jgi:Glycerol uptake facilitator and related permeases (Major Intrinsic Protein Family)
MFCAAFATVIVNHPDLFVRQHLQNELLRRFLIGVLMGLTALYILNSPFGKKSGAHINPAVTIVQYRLGNIDKLNALFYIIFQFIGGTAGMYLIYILMPHYIQHPDVNYIVTQPGKAGVAIAFILELIISFILIAIVLYTNVKKNLSKYTATCVAVLIAVFITFEAPYSGMSMNPARSFASAIVSGEWNSFWLYCIAPVLGMICGDIFITKVLKFKPPKVTLHND